jgi:hypothetical protein
MVFMQLFGFLPCELNCPSNGYCDPCVNKPESQSSIQKWEGPVNGMIVLKLMPSAQGVTHRDGSLNVYLRLSRRERDWDRLWLLVLSMQLTEEEAIQMNMHRYL